MSASINLAIREMNPRGRSTTRNPRNFRHEDAVDPISCGGSISTTSTYSIPRSHSPTSRTSRYVNRMHSLRLRTMLHPEGDEEYPGVRCTVTSLPYTNSRLGSSGFYWGKMDVASKLPDGDGILYCHDGNIVEGEWCLGRLLSNEPISARRCTESSDDTCCSSTCSSLSASITRHRVPTSVSEPNTEIVIPKTLYIIKSGPSNIIPCENSEVRVTRRESTVHCDKGAVDEIESCGVLPLSNRAANRTRLTFQPSFVSKVKHTFNRRL